MEENTLTTREQVEQDAKNGFRQGLNCSECVLGSPEYHRRAEKSGRKGNNGGTDTGTEWYL